MEASGYTIRIFVPDGDPDGVLVINQMNWTGIGVKFGRSQWPRVRQRKEFDRVGIYMLIGRNEQDEDLPRVYVGEGDGIRSRIESHYQSKDFWTWGVAFSSDANGLNKAHVQWLEHALLQLSLEVKQCTLDNANIPQKPELSEHEEADVRGFLGHMLRILPLVNLRAFERPTPILQQKDEVAKTKPITPDSREVLDTVVVPAQK